MKLFFHFVPFKGKVVSFINITKLERKFINLDFSIVKMYKLYLTSLLNGKYYFTFIHLTYITIYPIELSSS